MVWTNAVLKVDNGLGDAFGWMGVVGKKYGYEWEGSALELTGWSIAEHATILNPCFTLL